MEDFFVQTTEKASQTVWRAAEMYRKTAYLGVIFLKITLQTQYNMLLYPSENL